MAVHVHFCDADYDDDIQLTKTQKSSKACRPQHRPGLQLKQVLSVGRPFKFEAYLRRIHTNSMKVRIPRPRRPIPGMGKDLYDHSDALKGVSNWPMKSSALTLPIPCSMAAQKTSSKPR